MSEKQKVTGVQYGSSSAGDSYSHFINHMKDLFYYKIYLAYQILEEAELGKGERNVNNESYIFEWK
jgi:hypothetical protein